MSQRPGPPPIPPHRSRQNKIGLLVAAIGVLAFLLLLLVQVTFFPALFWNKPATSTNAKSPYNAKCPGCGRESWVPEHASVTAQMNWKYQCQECLSVNDEGTLRAVYRNAHKTAEEKKGEQEIADERARQDAERSNEGQRRLQEQLDESLRPAREEEQRLKEEWEELQRDGGFRKGKKR